MKRDFTFFSPKKVRNKTRLSTYPDCGTALAHNGREYILRDIHGNIVYVPMNVYKEEKETKKQESKQKAKTKALPEWAKVEL